MARLVRHRQTKGAETDRPILPPPRHIPTLPRTAGTTATVMRRGTATHGLQGTVVAACCAAVPGTTYRGTCAPPTATGSPPEAATSTTGSALPGRSRETGAYPGAPRPRRPDHPVPAVGLADMTGQASVIDGDTIENHGQRIRLQPQPPALEIGSLGTPDRAFATWGYSHIGSYLQRGSV